MNNIDNYNPLCYYNTMIELKARNEKIVKAYEKLIGKGAGRLLAKQYGLSERRITQIYRNYKIKQLLKQIKK